MDIVHLLVYDFNRDFCPMQIFTMFRIYNAANVQLYANIPRLTSIEIYRSYKVDESGDLSA